MHVPTATILTACCPRTSSSPLKGDKWRRRRQREFLGRNEPRSRAEIHDQRGCALTAGEVQRAALLAVDAGDLSWVHHQTERAWPLQAAGVRDPCSHGS